ncbi:TPA: DUF6531 domain-containing protein [Listeria monocytogenes]
MKKGIKILLVALLLFPLLPWQFVQGAVNVESEFGNYYGKQLSTQDKVTVADLNEDAQEQLKDKSTPEDTTLDEDLSDKNADAVRLFETETPNVTDTLAEDASAAGMTEIASERTENTKTFVNENTGEGETYYFTEPVHFKDDAGKWTDFNTTLVKDGEKNWTASETAKEITTPKVVTEEAMPTLSLDGANVAVRPSGEDDLAQVVAKDNRIMYASEDDNAEPFTLQADSFGMELGQYVKTGEDTEQQVTFDLTVPSDVTLKDDAKRAATLIYRGEELIGAIPSPVLEDETGSVMDTLTAKTVKTETGYQLQVAKFNTTNLKGNLAKVAVSFVSTKITNGIQATSLRQYRDDVAYSFQPYMYIGYDDGNNSGTLGAAHFITYGVVKVPDSEIKKIGTNREIESAELSLFRSGTEGFWGDRAKDSKGSVVKRLFEVHGITKDVGDIADLTYGKFKNLGFPYGPPANVDGKETYIGRIDDANRRVSFDITNVAKDWVNGGKNNGVIVKTAKVNAFELPYSQADVFAAPKSGVTSESPYVVFKHRERPPIDADMPLKDTKLYLRPFVSANNDGKLDFTALGMDGVGRPDAKINYKIIDTSDKNKVAFSGTDPSIGRDYLFPNYPKLSSETQEYRELMSNWQTNTLLLKGALKENHLYQVEAEIKDGNESVSKKYDTFQIYKVTGLDSLPRLLKFYGIANKRSQFMLDNNMKDELLVQGNVVFIRNPQKNAGKAYQSGNYDTADKMRLDALAIGRGKHCTFGYEPINFDSGNLLYNMEDAKWFDFDEEQTITRTYNSMAQGKDSPIGRNWTFNLADQLGFLEDGTVMLTRSDGGSVFFEKQPDGTFEIEEDEPLALTKKVNKNGAREFEIVDSKTGKISLFAANGLLLKVTSKDGNVTNYTYNADGELVKMVTDSGKILQYTWDADGHLKEIVLPDGGKLAYSYDDDGNLTKLVDQTGKAITYQYDSEHHMTSYKDHNGKLLIKNTFDADGRVTEQTDGEGNTATLKYEKGKTTTTDFNGNKKVVYFNERFQTTKIEYADDTTTENKYDDKHQLVASVDQLGNTTTFENDANGNLTKTVYPDGTTETNEFDAKNQLIRVTDSRGGVTSYTYDSKGNVVQITEPNGGVKKFTHNADGQVVTETDANGAVTKTAYDAKGNPTK